MALTARLQFGDNDARVYTEEYLVEDCQCHFTRHYNHSHPDTNPRCERVELTVVAPGKENLNLYEWYISGDVLTGRVLFDLTAAAKADAKAYKELLFEDARCFSMAEAYNITSARRRLIKLSFVADTITVDGVKFVNPYKE